MLLVAVALFAVLVSPHRAFGHAMGAQGQAFGQGMAAQRGMPDADDVRERIFEQQQELLDRQADVEERRAEQMRDEAERRRKKGSGLY